MTSRPLRIGLDARLRDGVAGGVQQFIMGLASGLSRLRDGEEEYLFLSVPGERSWLDPHLSGPCRTLDVALNAAVSGGRLRSGIVGLVNRAIGAALRSPFGALVRPAVPPSDGAIERAGVDLMHFTTQSAFRTALPTIYQPYDLQHVHLPRFFTAYERRARGVVYAESSRAARSVVVMSSWVKDDVVRLLSIPAAKVRVIPWAPVTAEYPKPTPEDLLRTRIRLKLPDAFALYPAQTFPHKNHLALVEAIAAARDRGQQLHVVCPGKQNGHYAEIARRVRRRRLQHLVAFPGYVTPLELQSLYRLARFLVFPTLFEGGGMPVFEAFAAGVAVACSDVTCLPKQVGDAGLLFDPREPSSIAEAMLRLWNDDALRADLARRGAERVGRFTWDRTARTYRALYRQVGGMPLTSEDQDLLNAAPET